MILSSVDLPLPFTPMKPQLSPLRMSSETSCSAWKSRYMRCVRCSRLRARRENGTTCAASVMTGCARRALGEDQMP